MNSHPSIGVVIPAFHAADDLHRTLSAFQALPDDVQSRLEVAVMDGGSTDRTLEVVSTFASLVKHTVSQQDAGVYDAMNRGARKIQSPFVWFMGAGDLPHAHGLSALLDRLHDAPHDGHACGVQAMSPREPGVPETFDPRFGRGLNWRNTLHHQGLVVPTDWIQNAPFSTAYRVLADYAWILDRRNEGKHIHCHPEVVLASVSGGGLSRQFRPALYREEHRLKKGRVTGVVRLAHLVWLPAKWAFKQMSKARSI